MAEPADIPHTHVGRGGAEGGQWGSGRESLVKRCHVSISAVPPNSGPLVRPEVVQCGLGLPSWFAILVCHLGILVCHLGI
jgi:hypothetical protein